MPSLIAFGRRWNIAADDFVFPGITEALVRFTWAFTALVIFFLHRPFSCSSPQLFVHIIMLIAVNILTAGLCVTLTAQSARGSILEVNARKHVATLIYIRVPIFIFEFIWTVVSTAFLIESFQLDDKCSFIHGFGVALLLEWLLILTMFFGVFVTFNPQGNRRMERSLMIERRYWRRRFALCKIGQDGDMRAALDEIATLMASFFVGSDYVLTDIVAGLLLLVHSPHHPAPPSAITEAPKDPPDWMRMPECLPTVSRMLDFAVAVYGWPTYLLNNCACAPWYRLCRTMRCCRSCNTKEVIVVEDNCFSCHTSAFVLESSCNDADLFFVSFRNRLYQVPFVVLTDHQTSSIVVTIRGSASLLDLITDLSLNEEVFSVDVDSDPILRQDEELDSEGEVRVHRGMLNGARYVYNTLKQNNVLEDLLTLNPNYRIVVCGHSLGAGVASLLTLLLKQTYPDIRCYAFSAPGCVISKHGLHEMEEHVLSVFVGDDLVPRTSYQSMLKLKDSIDQEIQTTTRAKFEILIKGCYKLFFSSPWELHSTPDPENGGSTRDSRRLIVEGMDGYGGTSEPNGGQLAVTTERIQLHPPGRLLHLTMEDDHIAWSWVNHEFLSEIRLSGSLITDHMPYRVRRVVRRACEEAVPV